MIRMLTHWPVIGWEPHNREPELPDRFQFGFQPDLASVSLHNLLADGKHLVHSFRSALAGHWLGASQSRTGIARSLSIWIPARSCLRVAPQFACRRQALSPLIHCLNYLSGACTRSEERRVGKEC